MCSRIAQRLASRLIAPGAARLVLVLAGAVVSGAWLPAVVLAQASTHVEYDLEHVEQVGAGNFVTLVDSNPGQDDAASILVTGGLVGTYGDHNLRIEAGVLATADNTVRLRAEGEHVFTLSGIDRNTDVWETTDSTILARAELVDVLSLSNVGGSAATVELYFQVRGMSEALIDITGSGDLRYTMNTQVRLEASTSAPHSGGGIHDMSIGWPGGYLPRDLDDQKFADEYVMLSLDVDPNEDIPVEIRFEIEPVTGLDNGVEINALDVTGLHRASFWDNAAELLGVVVRDEFGVVVPNATISSSSGYDYPVEEEPPPPIPPAKVILSPVAVVESDLGEEDPVQAPFENMIDQSGLREPFTSGQTGFDVYFSNPDAERTDTTGNWQSETVFTLPLQGYIDFDLGADHRIDRLAIWNVSLEDIRVQIAMDAAGPWTEVGEYNLTTNVFAFSSFPVQVLDFGAEYDAHYLRIEVDSAHLYSSSFTYAVVGEVAVSSLTPVPEPGGVLMAWSGVCVLVLLCRMRNRRRDDVAQISGEP